MTKFLFISFAKHFIRKANGKTASNTLKVEPESSLKAWRTFGSFLNIFTHKLSDDSSKQKQESVSSFDASTWPIGYK